VTFISEIATRWRKEAALKLRREETRREIEMSKGFWTPTKITKKHKTRIPLLDLAGAKIIPYDCTETDYKSNFEANPSFGEFIRRQTTTH